MVVPVVVAVAVALGRAGGCVGRSVGHFGFLRTRCGTALICRDPKITSKCPGRLQSCCDEAQYSGEPAETGLSACRCRSAPTPTFGIGWGWDQARSDSPCTRQVN